MRWLTPRGAFLGLGIFILGVLVYHVFDNRSYNSRRDRETWVEGVKMDEPAHGGVYDYLVSILRTSRPKTSSGNGVDPANLVDDGTPLDMLPLLPPEYSKYYPNLLLPESLTSPNSSRHLALALHAFLSRPVLSHSEYMSPENAEWTEKCPRRLSDQTTVTYNVENNGAWWRDVVDKRLIRQKRVAMVEHLKELLESGQEVVRKVEEGQKKKRGLVLTGGNTDTTARLLAQLRILRKVHKCDLPAEVFLFPEEITDPREREEIVSLGGTLREVHNLGKTPTWKQYQIKGVALATTTFDEFLYLDSDNIPLRDPSYLFHSKAYNAKDSGRFVLWPDISKDHPDNAIWRLIGDHCSLDMWTIESGQILVDKTGNNGLNLAGLHLAKFMQDPGDQDFYFRMCGGDKDTFRWSMRALDLPFIHSPRWKSTLGAPYPYDNDRYCGNTIVQYELDIQPGETRERPLFMHSNLLKHQGFQTSERRVFTHLKRMSMDKYDEPTLNEAHMWVVDIPHGLCTDLEIWEGNSLTEQEKKKQYVMHVPIEEVEGKPFAGFEEMFFEHGGRAPGH